MIEYIIKIKKVTKNIFQDPWVWKMAWRDGRQNLSRLFLFTAALITGISAVVAISSLNYSLQEELDRNAKELLGADLVLNSNKKFETDIFSVIDTTKQQIARDADMASMVMFMNTQQSRLVKLTAMKGDFPFYGEMATFPSNAYELMKTGRYAMMDESLASQYQISSEDSIKVGTKIFKMAGVVTKIPGGGGLTSTLAPAVYISLDALDSTGLVQFGSRVGYSLYVKTRSEIETNKLIERIKPLSKKIGFGYETVQARRDGLGQGLKSVYRFFSLLAFVALVLGCIGVASSVHIYAREKRDDVAILRCIGSSGWQAFNIYFIQIFVLGIIGSVVGSGLGVVIHQSIPFVFQEYIPLKLQFAISWRAIVEGIILGAIVSVLFTLLPLVSVRFVPPLTVLRADFDPGKFFSKTKWLAIGLIVLFPILAAAYQTKSLLTGALFSVGLAVALCLLALVAIGLLFFVRRYFPTNASFIFRHALSNLFRPNNQTRVLMVTIGLGTFIISTLNVIEKSLLNQVEFSGGKNQSNTILFDIQPNQKEGVVKLIKDQPLPVNQVVPIITCRIKELKGKSIEEIQKDTTSIPEWALTREYRVTYRDSLTSSEELIKGDLQKYYPQKKDSVFVTISEGMHETLQLKIGDSLVFDLQGVPMKAWIGGIRKVNWPKDPPNFIFVFPTGVLENAPQIYVASTRVDDPQVATRFQRALVTDYSNVSLIDLRLILSTVDELFNKIGLVVRFLALFSIVTGLVVLAGAVMNSKFVRMKENVLLRTIGARTSQLTKITLIEYGYLGVFSAFTGMLLSLGGGWLLTKFFFDVQFSIDPYELAAIGAGVIFLTVFIGWFNSREVISTPPLQVLRKEG
ncbi:MAG: FtsX-like permease family protein [Cytophagales bacterium]|jgi:putative ABC transport system permease protein|nr:FtsX-like permease family protein [Cytophagales bacterium]MCA6386781.1 FtsX-like permease family protein [Cytophagales bacterium]MCA6391648.1 FtsX-like permease family protein [Cytophagales bacterium]MCA6394023.1 FtsX-like permease family protein [Cytophagales bacterium]MCA6399255.1 FtsX-like permease family protein [Cytophagales bacterium]